VCGGGGGAHTHTLSDCACVLTREIQVRVPVPALVCLCTCIRALFPPIRIIPDYVWLVCSCVPHTQEERQFKEALEASKRTAELEQQQQAALSAQAAALHSDFHAPPSPARQQQGDYTAMDEDTSGHSDAFGTSDATAAAAGPGSFGPSFAAGVGGRGRGRAGRGLRGGRTARRGTGAGGYGGTAGSNGPQWQQYEGFEGIGESSDPTEGPPPAKHRPPQQVDLPPESDAAGAHAHRAAGEGTQRGPTAAFMAAATAAGARAQQQQQQGAPSQQQRQRQQSEQAKWQPRKPAVSAGSSTTCNIVDDASGSDSDSDSVTGPFAGACVCVGKGGKLAS
jgi:hypothetical protein